MCNFIFDSVLLDACDQTIPSVDIILRKCRKITGFFNSSPKNTAALKKELQARNLPFRSLLQAVVTRWNSSYFMLERIQQNLDCINIILTRVKNDVPLLTPDEVAAIPDMLTCLKPFVEATKDLSGACYTTISLLIPYTKQILEELKTFKPDTVCGQNLLQKLIKLTETKLLSYETRSCSA